MSRHVRRIVFGARSALPTSAACVVANGVRETLARLLGVPVEVGLSEPAIPGADAWPEIVREAILYRIAGAVADAAIVLRRRDALALTGALFGELDEDRQPRALSPIENDVLDRTVSAMAAHLGAVCGARESHPVERVESLGRFTTYFEMFIESPLAARVGVALSRDPQPAPQRRFEIGHLADVPLQLRASMELGLLRGGEVAALQPGTLLPIGLWRLQRCALHFAGRPIVRGGCGVRNGHYAFTVAPV